MYIPRIYLAGPDVFYQDALEVGIKKKKICETMGFEGIFPLDSVMSKTSTTKFDISKEIFDNNINLINSCDVIFANLTPFRGVSADVGTTFEIGYAFGRNMKVFGYSNSPLNLYERTTKKFGFKYHDPKIGADDMLIENFDLSDNLMIDHALISSTGFSLFCPFATKGKMTASPSEKIEGDDYLYDDLAIFSKALKIISDHILRD